MSERLKHRGEHNENQHNDLQEHQEALKDQVEKAAERASHEHAKNIEKIRSTVETEAEAKHEHTAKKKHEKDGPEVERPTFINKELKDLAYQRTLRRTRSKLSAPARVMSKFMHQPTVEAVSEVASKTVARPSGVLMGGIAAFIASSFFLWAARHYGYEYNFLLFALFFVGGFFIGLLVELGLYMADRKSKNR